MLEKQKADEKMVELRKARAKEDADFAAVEAAAAAEEWKQVYALRIEREEADRRAAEAAEKLKQVEQEAARRCGLVPEVVLNFSDGLNSRMHRRLRVAAQQAAEKKQEEDAALAASRRVKAAEEKQARLDAMRDQGGEFAIPSGRQCWSMTGPDHIQFGNRNKT